MTLLASMVSSVQWSDLCFPAIYILLNIIPSSQLWDFAGDMRTPYCFSWQNCKSEIERQDVELSLPSIPDSRPPKVHPFCPQVAWPVYFAPVDQKCSRRNYFRWNLWQTSPGSESCTLQVYISIWTVLSCINSYNMSGRFREGGPVSGGEFWVILL